MMASSADITGRKPDHVRSWFRSSRDNHTLSVLGWVRDDGHLVSGAKAD